LVVAVVVATTRLLGKMAVLAAVAVDTMTLEQMPVERPLKLLAWAMLVVQLIQTLVVITLEEVVVVLERLVGLLEVETL
jgi:hypothetical protein